MAAIASVGMTAMGGESEMDRLMQMRMQPTASLYNQAISARVSDTIVLADTGTSMVSLTSVEAPAPRRYKKHDLITIVVSQNSETTTNETTNQERKQDYDLALQQFLEFARFAGTLGIGNVTNPGKLPEIKFKLDNSRDANSSKSRQDHIALRITAEIIDVKPNGTLVLEASSYIRTDREEQSMRLSGVCRIEDVDASNTILSSQLANLNLAKEHKGEVHDGTKRSWLNKFIDNIGP
jgi:flagellar L-ring protein precursor FlgH